MLCSRLTGLTLLHSRAECALVYWYSGSYGIQHAIDLIRYSCIYRIDLLHIYVQARRPGPLPAGIKTDRR